MLCGRIELFAGGSEGVRELGAPAGWAVVCSARLLKSHAKTRSREENARGSLGRQGARKLGPPAAPIIDREMDRGIRAVLLAVQYYRSVVPAFYRRGADSAVLP